MTFPGPRRQHRIYVGVLLMKIQPEPVLQADFLQPQPPHRASLDRRSQSEQLAYGRSVRQSSDEEASLVLRRTGSQSPSMRLAMYQRGGSLPTLLSRQVAHWVSKPDVKLAPLAVPSAYKLA